MTDIPPDDKRDRRLLANWIQWFLCGPYDGGLFRWYLVGQRRIGRKWGVICTSNETDLQNCANDMSEQILERKKLIGP